MSAAEDNAQRALEARENRWQLSEDGHSMSREYLGHHLRVELEDGGYRLFVDDQRRGYFDRASGARIHGLWLIDHGNPAWKASYEVKTTRRNRPWRKVHMPPVEDAQP